MEEDFKNRQNQEAQPSQVEMPQGQSDQKRLIKIVVFILSGLVLLVGTFYAGVQYLEKKTPGPLTTLPTPTPKIKEDIADDETNKYSIPSYSDPSGFYKLYYTVNPETFSVDVFVETREIEPKVTKALELGEFHGEITEVSWSRGQTNLCKQRFILKTIGPGDTSSDYLLSVDGSTAVKIEFPYTYFRFFRVLTWIDEERILVEQTDSDENTGETTRTYWVAPVTDLDQKKIIDF